MNTLVVLWLYFASPWSWYGIPMSAVRASIAVLDAGACAEAQARSRTLAVCAAPDVTLHPLASLDRKE